VDPSAAISFTLLSENSYILAKICGIPENLGDFTIFGRSIGILTISVEFPNENTYTGLIFVDALVEKDPGAFILFRSVEGDVECPWEKFDGVYLEFSDSPHRIEEGLGNLFAGIQASFPDSFFPHSVVFPEIVNPFWINFDL
jgi:hypothetical protein